MSEFPAAEFHLDGEPTAIRTSAAHWTAFGTAAREAAIDIRSLDSSLFVGPEADQYRDGLNQDLPPHLDTTAKAYTAVGSTLTTYASTLTALQDRMAPLRVKAPALWADLQQAQHRVSSAETTDHQHQLHTDTHPPAAENYHSDLGAATTSLSAAEHAWNTCLAAARAITTDLRAAIDTTTRAIREAADLRFAHNPHGVHALTSGFKNFVTDHAKGLSQLSNALKVVSAVAAVLSFIPVIGQAAFAVSLLTAGAAILIDASLKYATGKGSWKTIAIDGALLVAPFGIGKGVTAIRTARTAKTLANQGVRAGSTLGEIPAGAVPAATHQAPIGAVPEKAWKVLNRVKSKGSPLPNYKGGRIFEDMNGKLPSIDKSGNPISYREWDLSPQVKGVQRNAERIVTGSDGAAYYTNDHYETFTMFRGAGE